MIRRADGSLVGTVDEVCDALGLPPALSGEFGMFEAASVENLLTEALERIDRVAGLVDPVDQRRLDVARRAVRAVLLRSGLAGRNP